jgi:sialate O-acetylesterase
MRRFVFIWIALTALCFVQLETGAKVWLPAIFSDNMVLQQQSAAGIWGKADPGRTVSVFTSWNGKTVRVKADGKGDWQTKLPTPSFGGPFTITVTEKNRIVLKNVMIGEVWLCSGQSNMEMPLAGWGRINHFQEEIERANYPQIRLLQAIHKTADRPVDDLAVRNGGWESCSPATIPEFSAVAYFFAREIYDKTKIPIGLIHSSWGGTIAEAWTSFETLRSLPDFAAAATAIHNSPVSGATVDFAATLRNWENNLKLKDPGFKGGNPVWAADNLDVSAWKTMTLPVLWENAGLPDYDGVVWFRKKIQVPESWNGEDLVVSLGPIDDQDVTWFNGHQIGATNLYSTARVYKVPGRLVKKGENTISVRVFDTGGGGGIYGDASEMFIKNKKGDKISLAGNWIYQPSFSMKDAPPRPADPSNPNRPTVLYNAMINPIIHYTIRGAIWYQGESNASRAYQYRTLLPAMITDWRQKFDVGDFPFYIVQLANYMKRAENPGPSAWAELRESQLLTAETLSNSGLAVTIDIGNAADIHPKNKQDVGKRLALIALNKVYSKGNEYSGPLYRSGKIEGDAIRIHFDHSEGLQAKGGSLHGFSIAGKDRKFFWADAKISGKDVLVSSPNVKEPVSVRYGWADNPDVNLYNGAQLPASPFRTDTWEESTFGKK